MADFINTAEVIGDDRLTNSIIDRTVTEYCDDSVEVIGVSAFHKCDKLVTVNCPKVDIKHFGAKTFSGCTSLKNVHYDTTVYHGLGYPTDMFRSCSSLEEIILYGNSGQTMFADCTALKKVDMLAGSVSGYSCFQGCNSLIMLILRKTDSIHTLGNVSFFDGTPIASGTGYIYVPRALVDTYKAATNWSTYANQFRALEDYTVDGTTTGELDETKI